MRSAILLQAEPPRTAHREPGEWRPPSGHSPKVFFGQLLSEEQPRTADHGLSWEGQLRSAMSQDGLRVRAFRADDAQLLCALVPGASRGSQLSHRRMNLVLRS